MADLRKFSDLFTELENKVVLLDKRESDLAGSITTLAAKETYLRDSIADLEKQTKEAIKQHTAAEEKRQEELSVLDDTIEDVKGYIKVLEASQKEAKAESETLEARQNKKLEEFDEKVQTKKDKLAEADQRITDLKLEESDLKGKTAALRGDIQELASTLEKKQAGFEDILKLLASKEHKANQDYQIAIGKLDDKLDELEEIEIKLRTAQKDIKVIEGKSEEFTKYESETRIALDAREKSIIEEERQLQVRVITSRRRNPGLKAV